MAVIGEAEVRVVPDTRGFGQQVKDDIEDPVVKTGKRIGVALAAAFSVQQVGAFFKDAIDAASAAEEATSKVSVVFGDAADSVLAFGEGSAEAFGQSNTQAIQAAGNFGNLFRAIGLTEEKSAEFATSLTGLASDLASFNDTDVDTALTALRSGLVGEAEPLRNFGVQLSAARIETKALELGLAANKDQLDEAAKAQAAYQIILEDTTLAQGDFARTSDGVANSQRILAAQFAEAKTELGQGLLPIASEFIGLAGEELIPLITELGGVAVPLLSAAFDTASPFIGTTTTILEALLPVVTLLAEVVDDIPDPILQIAAAGVAVNRVGGPLLKNLDGIQGALGSLTGTAAGAADSLRRINPAAIAATGAIAAGVLVYQEVTAESERYEEQVKKTAEALGVAVEAQEDLNEATRGFIAEDLTTQLGEGGLLKGLRAFEVGLDDVEQAIAEGGDALDPLTERVLELGFSLDEVGGDIGKLSELDRVSPLARELADALGLTVGELARFIDALEDQDDAIQDSNRAVAEKLVLDKAVTDAQFELARSQNASFQEGVNWAGVVRDLQPLLQDQAEATDEAGTAAGEAVAPTEDLTGALGNLEDGLINSISELENYLEAVNEAFGVELDYEESLLATQDALEDVTSAALDLIAARGPQGAREVALAEEELAETIAEQQRVYADAEATQLDKLRADEAVADAQENVAEVAGRVAEAERGLADAQRDAVDAVLASEQAIRDKIAADNEGISSAEIARLAQAEYKEELEKVRDTLDPNSPLAQNLDEYINNLDDTTGNFVATVDANTEAARAELDSLQADYQDRAIEIPVDLIGRTAQVAGERIRFFQEGFYGTVSSATPFVAGEAGAEDVLVVPTAVGGIAKVVEDLASRLEPAGGGTRGASRGGVVVSPGAIQVVAGPDASPQAVAREVIDRLGYELTVRGDV